MVSLLWPVIRIIGSSGYRALRASSQAVLSPSGSRWSRNTQSKLEDSSSDRPSLPLHASRKFRVEPDRLQHRPPEEKGFVRAFRDDENLQTLPDNTRLGVCFDCRHFTDHKVLRNDSRTIPLPLVRRSWFTNTSNYSSASIVTKAPSPVRAPGSPPSFRTA